MLNLLKPFRKILHAEYKYGDFFLLWILAIVSLVQFLIEEAFVYLLSFMVAALCVGYSFFRHNTPKEPLFLIGFSFYWLSDIYSLGANYFNVIILVGSTILLGISLFIVKKTKIS